MNIDEALSFLLLIKNKTMKVWNIDGFALFMRKLYSLVFRILSLSCLEKNSLLDRQPHHGGGVQNSYSNNKDSLISYFKFCN